MFVYVLNKYGKPLMPCEPRKARILLKSSKAKVVRRTPFTPVGPRKPLASAMGMNWPCLSFSFVL